MSHQLSRENRIWEHSHPLHSPVQIDSASKISTNPQLPSDNNPLDENDQSQELYTSSSVSHVR